MGAQASSKSFFKPKHGQIDFSKSRWAPVVNCVVCFRKKILIVQRSRALRYYPGLWNGISGFLDDRKSLEEKALEELSEEVGLEKNQIVSFRRGEIFDQDAPRYSKTWIVHPVLVKVKTDEVRLDPEAQRYRWVSLTEARRLELVPGFDKVLKNLSHWIL
ncbi:MAG: NUDIX domain-containing protein [bacterium]|nr:NUDIX domain-containing protein [bacterium]